MSASAAVLLAAAPPPSPVARASRHAAGALAGRIVFKALAVSCGAAVASLVILAAALRLHHADLAVPLYYANDQILFQALIKGTVENGWYLHNGSLAMPDGLELRDFPMADSLHFLLIKGLAWAVGDPVVAMNLYYLLTYPLTTLTALFALRRWRLSYPVATVAALLFAFLPYHLNRHMGHLFLASYYLVPLMALVILGIYTGRLSVTGGDEETGKRRSGWKLVAAAGLCALMGAGGVYYAFFGCCLLLAAGVAGSYTARKLVPLGSALVLTMIVACSTVLVLSPSLLYRMQQGANPEAVFRRSGEAEIFGLKLAQLVLPVTGHRVPFLAELKERYNHPETPVINENDMATLGVVGSVGFLLLLGRFFLRRPAAGKRELADGLALLTVAAFFLATVGGVGSVLSLLGLREIRGYNRISVYIGFFALANAALVFQWIADRFVRTRTAKGVGLVLLAGLLAAGLCDQVPDRFIPAYGKYQEEYHAEAEFVRRMEAQVPAGTLVFELPYVPFPEPAPCRDLMAYDLLRPYLHSQQLRWSYGAMRGRAGDAWQRQVAARPVEEMLSTLTAAGFGAIYIDRSGFADQGAGLEEELTRHLGTTPLVSADRRLAFFDLSGASKRTSCP